jgi:hypothetical protein
MTRVRALVALHDRRGVVRRPVVEQDEREVGIVCASTAAIVSSR